MTWRLIDRWGVAPRILNPGTWRKWDVHFNPRPLLISRKLNTRFLRGLVGPRADIKPVDKRQILCRQRNQITRLCFSQCLDRTNLAPSFLKTYWNRFKIIMTNRTTLILSACNYLYVPSALFPPIVTLTLMILELYIHINGYIYIYIYIYIYFIYTELPELQGLQQVLRT
jgi:hypothetical protein